MQKVRERAYNRRVLPCFGRIVQGGRLEEVQHAFAADVEIGAALSHGVCAEPLLEVGYELCETTAGGARIDGQEERDDPTVEVPALRGNHRILEIGELVEQYVYTVLLDRTG